MANEGKDFAPRPPYNTASGRPYPTPLYVIHTLSNNSEDCRCGRIRIGMTVTEHRNWNPDCPEHGAGTEWHKGEGGDRLREQNERAVEMQRRAREARRGK